MSNNTTAECLCSDCWEPRPVAELGAGAYIVIIFLALVNLCTVFGNLLVIIVVLKYESLRKRITNYFIVSLGVVDLLVGILVMPFAIVQDFGGTWPFGQYCHFWFSFDVMLSSTSIFNLCLISIERYIAVTRPFHYHEIMTKKTAIIMIVSAWIVAAGLSLGPIMSDAYQLEGELTFWIQSVDPTAPFCKPSMKAEYAIGSSMVSFYIPTICMIVIYTRVLMIARHHSRQIAAMETAQRSITKAPPKKSENKANKTIALVLGIFIACWLPFFTINLFFTAFPAEMLCQRGMLDVFLTFVWLGWINSTLNVFIYSINPSFRRAYKKFLCCGRIQDNTQDIYTAHTSG